MTIDEAIKEIEDIILNDPPCWEPKTNNALKLGIEALKFTKNLRDTAYITKLHLLPGETKD